MDQILRGQAPLEIFHGHGAALTLPPVWRRLLERAGTEADTALRRIDRALGAERLANTRVELDSGDAAETYKEILTENEQERFAT